MGKDDRVRLCHEKMFEAYNLPENRDSDDEQHPL